MLKSYKTEIILNEQQKKIFKQTIGVCRFAYNFFIAHNQEKYKKSNKFISGMDFSKWLNNDFIPNNPEYSWIKDVYAKAVKQSIMNADKAFRKFFKGESRFPRFKKKKNQDVKMYFVKNDAKTVIPCERHRIKIPTLGWVKIKEKGYLPTNATIKSGTVSQKTDRYYVSVLVEEDAASESTDSNDGIGVDLGLKEFAVISSQDRPVKNINKTARVRKIEKSLKRQQRKLSRKYESAKKNKNKKEETATRQNIHKQVLKVQKLHYRLSNIRENHINQTINMIIKQKPRFITIEDLNVRGMMKNRHLAKAVAQQCFNQFKTKLEVKCKINGIELRIVDRFYPSSKLCSCCGHRKVDLKLSDRIYVCDNCGNTMDRDMNAAVNLKNAKIYKVA
ncbi:RNA-guided endonuclease InsQ/TnpB family protein [Paenibacillus naphthalenovorans]|uniref:Transposase IS605 n=1 Tax=Paenibacillus naphthalenovorans TaxID=162209 RepID=A0A0U2VF50_9BACL|nr:RNA-guided endonuclease TnpB family protein [Paenibacillus naphthalenovorans]ALS22147.1 transposase IS605 [Paenibacillus naphthalenovorans]